MNIFFTSDQHFGHPAVIDYCQRPFTDSVSQTVALIDFWNKKVGPGDLVYCLGDMFMCNWVIAMDIMSRLNGFKILIQGNHDNLSATQYNKIGFLCVLREARIKLRGHNLRLSHYPYRPSVLDRVMGWEDKRYLHRRPLKNKHDAALLCGHVHKAWQTKGSMINVGVDVWNYKPVSTEEIVSILDQRKKDAAYSWAPSLLGGV